jgi:pyruvate/2-oxoglutarate dehydrogenase complex dihydrolipoamide acyltransferase (E2) component
MQEIKIPKRGMTNTPILIANWLIKEGDKVNIGNELVAIEAEKVNYTIEAEISGYVHILIREGKEVPIGTVIGIVAEKLEEYQNIKNIKNNKSLVTPPSNSEYEIEREEKKEKPIVSTSLKESEGVRISPAARRLAKKNEIDLKSVRGTGPKGIIIKEDIQKLIHHKDEKKENLDSYDGRKVGERISFSQMRKQIAEHMIRSLSVSAQLTLMGEIDMIEMKKIHEEMISQEEILGTRISYTALFVYLIAKQLKKHPIINASIIENEIILWDSINIGIATALENGLIVPVIKDADKKNLSSLNLELKELVKKAREENLEFNDVTGGTFTISNLGSFSGAGYRFETPIINQPESAILGLGGISDRAVVREDKIVIRPILTYYFTYDHRIIDGLVAAKFMKSVRETFEQPFSYVDLNNLQRLNVTDKLSRNQIFNR